MVGITTQGSWTSDEAQNMSIHRIQVFRPITIISAVIGNLILLLLVYHRTSKPVVARGFVLIMVTGLANLMVIQLTLVPLALERCNCDAIQWLLNFGTSLTLGSITARGHRVMILGKLANMLAAAQVRSPQNKRSSGYWIRCSKLGLTRDKPAVVGLLVGVVPLNFIICMLVTFYAPYTYSQPEGVCRFPIWAFTPILAAISGFIVTCPVVLYFGRGVKDTFGILQELKCSMIVIIVTYIIMAVAGSTEINSAGLTIFTVLSLIANWINFIISCVTPLFQVYGLTLPYFRAKISQLMGRDAGSTQIAYSAEHFYLALLDKEYYEEIKAYAIKEWTIENIVFVETYMHLLSQAEVHLRSDLIIYCLEPLSSYYLDMKVLRSSVQDLYDSLLSPKAPSQLNVDAHILREIEAVLAHNTPLIELRYLEPLKQQVLRMIYENTFRGFVNECRFDPRKRALSIPKDSRRRSRSSHDSSNRSLRSASLGGGSPL